MVTLRYGPSPGVVAIAAQMCGKIPVLVPKTCTTKNVEALGQNEMVPSLMVWHGALDLKR